MKPDDIEKIEAELGISLPSSYKTMVSDFPIPALVGNSDTNFWDDADKLIDLNKKLREKEKFRDPWPKRFFALGEDAGGCSDAIDLDDPEFGVFWFDRQHIDISAKDRSELKIESWVSRQIKDHTHDLMVDGIDPNGTPEQRDEEYDRSSKGGCFGIIFIAVFITVILLIGVWIGMNK